MIVADVVAPGRSLTLATFPSLRRSIRGVLTGAVEAAVQADLALSVLLTGS
jgi:hypothetical protein